MRNISPLKQRAPLRTKNMVPVGWALTKAPYPRSSRNTPVTSSSATRYCETGSGSAPSRARACSTFCLNSARRTSSVGKPSIRACACLPRGVFGLTVFLNGSLPDDLYGRIESAVGPRYSLPVDTCCACGAASGLAAGAGLSCAKAVTDMVRRNRTINVIPLISFTFIAPTPLFLRCWSRWRSRCTRWRHRGLLHCQFLEVVSRYIVSSHHKRTVYGSAHLLSAV